jgi:hypothetical protein
MNSKDFTEIPIFVLSTYGHNGIDWLHSLLDGSEELLIMPAFSFFRTLNAIGINKNDSNQKIVDSLIKNFRFNPTYLVRRRKFLYSEDDFNNFSKNLHLYLDTTNEKNFIKKLFYGIHFTFALIKKIDLKYIKAIIVQEHVPFYITNYHTIFNSSFIMMMRDPRAAIAGSIKSMSRVQPDKKLNAHDFNYIILYWLFAREQIRKIRLDNNKVKFMQNEKMHINLEFEMKKLCDWLGIRFTKNNLFQTILKEPWSGESAYLPVNSEMDLLNDVPINYYKQEEVNKRWRSQIDKNVINMIEVICGFEMKKFNYNCDNKKNFFNNIYGYFKYFTVFRKIRTQHDSLYWRLLQIIKERIVRVMTIFSPKLTHYFFKRL